MRLLYTSVWQSHMPKSGVEPSSRPRRSELHSHNKEGWSCRGKSLAVLASPSGLDHNKRFNLIKLVLSQSMDIQVPG